MGQNENLQVPRIRENFERTFAPAGLSLCAVVSLTGIPACSPTEDSVCETAGVICTVAGTGRAQFDGDGRDALDTSFYLPLDIEFDARGRTLILDWNNLRVRRINTDGTIETIIGNGFENEVVDGQPAIEASLHHASDIEFDIDGKLYLAGDHAPLVFRINTDDRVQIVAGTGFYGYSGDGGLALDAELGAPYGVLPDDRGGLYISDVDFHVIRYVDAHGIITTIAGTGESGYSGDGGPATLAQLHGPTRLRLSPAGQLYFCDTDNSVIRRVDSAGVITTVAGNGVAGYSGDEGSATLAQLNRPQEIRFTPNGDLLIGDTRNAVIRHIDSTGIIRTVIGTGVEGYHGDGEDATLCHLDRPAGMIIAADGSLWIADAYNDRVRRVARFAERYSE